ncbi:MAG: hypothetical protein MRY49_02540, partial [Candidatus Pacebacteria bacterium]|nr:hypothetical protein [Candidatus Paceibacterota bacterium]
MGKSSRFLVSIKVFLYALVLSLISKGIYTNTDININDEKVIEEPSDTSFSDILLSIILPPTRIAYAAPPSSPYTAGETLDPSCSPGDTNCSVDHDPQGSAGNIQYNNYGLFGASSDLTYATTTGNFGIGTSSPYAKLSVTGQIVANYFTATSTTATSTLAGALKFSTSGWGIEFADGTIQTTAATGGGSGQDHTFPFVAASGWASSVSTSTPVIFTGGIGTTATSTFNATTTFGSRVYQTGLGESTFFGYQAGENDDLTSNNNTAFGYQALTANTSGIRNTAVGYQSLMSNTTGSFNTASGYHALKSNTTGCSNIAIGNNSLKSNTTGCSNIAIGHGALCLNTEARGNTAVGNCALLANTTGCFNTASGGFALGGNTEGFRNSTFGYQALCKNTTGCDNIAVGFQSADNLTTGSNNIFIGHNIDAQSATASNQLSIGNLLFSNGIDGTGTSLSSGNLGIGTTTPGSKLSVAGDSFISGTSTAAALELHGQNTGIRFSDGTYQT